DILTQNPIFLARTKNVARIKPEEAISFGVSGPILRASGVNVDLRKTRPYGVYDKFEFDVPLGDKGDCWDRYKVRIIEMRQSLRIVKQALNGIPEGPFKNKVALNLKPPEGEAYEPVESPRGELGFFIISKGGNKPYRLKVRAPSFCNISMIGEVLKGWKIADVVAVLGTFDIVLGEIDR
ncbi:MAG: NADH-quinone oxidoreductase subunit D, partial [Candidatus Margulisiibacteriota bacterium]